jgi:hypothetical protein
MCLKIRDCGPIFDSESVAAVRPQVISREYAMNIVCNDPVLYVVDYPAIDAIEVIDKRIGRGTLMRAETARRFRSELQAWAASPDPEAFERLMEQYGALMTQRAVYH